MGAETSLDRGISRSLRSSTSLMDKASVTLEAVKTVIKQDKQSNPQETYGSEAPRKSILIGSKKKNKNRAKSRFLDSDGRWNWDRLDAWIPPQPIESIQSTITIPPNNLDESRQKGSWDRWGAWSPPNPVESTTQNISNLLYMEENLKTQQKHIRPLKSKNQEVGDRRNDVKQVNRRAEQNDGTSDPAEAMTTWRSLLMMPKSNKKRKEISTLHPNPVTQQYIKETTTPKVDRDWNDSFFYYDEELINGEERNGKDEKEDVKYSEMEAELGGWEKSSAVKLNISVLLVMDIVGILIIATEKPCI